MKRSVLVFAKKKSSDALKASEKLQGWLKKNGYSTIDVTQTEGVIAETKVKNVQLGVVIGGDGTFLTLVRRLEKKDLFPLMGVNLGTLGFITEVNKEVMLETTKAALAGEYPEEFRRLLDVELWRDGKRRETGTIFNDAVITKDARTTMLKFEVSAGTEFLNHMRADGYIVSTPTGSTAYALSVGGPLLHPRVDAMLLVPICAHSLSARPILLPPTLPVEITMRELNGKAYLVYDGQINFEVKARDQIKIQSSKAFLRLIKTPQLKWSEALRTKLNME